MIISIEQLPDIKIQIAESGQSRKKGYFRFEIGKEIIFSTDDLNAYAFKNWEPIVYDAMVVTAAVECGDRFCKRPSDSWARKINMSIPVYNIEKWQSPLIHKSLINVLQFLTGDTWKIDFVKNCKTEATFVKKFLPLEVCTSHILAYSDGLDSYMVAGLLQPVLLDKLLRIRVSKGNSNKQKDTFTRVPYHINFPKKTLESSARNRGFRFAMISSIAAYLTQAKNIIIPESWQGSIGPALITVGQAYPDYRNHPKFTRMMEQLIRLLFNKEVKFIFPVLWQTKSETLYNYITNNPESSWQTTKSCWKDPRWSSVNGKQRQCGICAACMLRRVSIFNAGLAETRDTYICEDLNATDIKKSVNSNFAQMNSNFIAYAIGGIMFMDNLAKLAQREGEIEIIRQSYILAESLNIPVEEAQKKLYSAVKKHAEEWNNFLSSLNENSFIKKWIGYKNDEHI